MKKTPEEIHKVIIDAILSADVTLEKKDLLLDAGLLREGIIDSYAFVELIGELEERLDIEFKDEDINPENFHSINSTASFIDKDYNS